MSETPSRRTPPTDEELRELSPPVVGARDLRIGIFVLLGIAAILAILFMLTDPSTFRGRYQVTTLVDDAGGIRSGDPVQMRGVNIGRVRQFTLTEDGVVINLEIEGRWAIPEDSRTRLVSNGLLGGRTVDVVPGRSPSAVTRGAQLPGELIPSVFETADDVGGDALDIMNRVQRLLSDTTLGAVQSGATELEGLVRELGELTRSQRGEVARLTASLNRAALQVEEAAATGGPDLSRALARADSLMVELGRTGATLDAAAASLNAVLARMERGEGTLGLLSTDEALYRNMTEASGNLAALMQDIQENPGRYIRLSLF